MGLNKMGKDNEARITPVESALPGIQFGTFLVKQSPENPGVATTVFVTDINPPLYELTKTSGKRPERSWVNLQPTEDPGVLTNRNGRCLYYNPREVDPEVLAERFGYLENRQDQTAERPDIGTLRSAKRDMGIRRGSLGQVGL
jgi:hypothetical protein